MLVGPARPLEAVDLGPLKQGARCATCLLVMVQKITLLIFSLFCLVAPLKAEWGAVPSDRDRQLETVIQLEDLNAYTIFMQENHAEYLRGINLGVWTLVGLFCGFIIYHAIGGMLR